MKRVSILLVILIVAPLACGTAEEPSDQTQPAPVVDKAISDLSDRLDVNADQIETRSVQEVTWSDGSLGCPQPGMFYTQALVEGSRVVLEHEDRFYDYHAGADDEPFLCESEAEDGGYDSEPPLEGTAA